MNTRDADPLSLKPLLVPAPADLLAMRPASPLANSVKNEGPALLVQQHPLLFKQAPSKVVIL